jgi:hypothetical protein
LFVCLQHTEQYLTPERFGEMLCDDLELSHRFVQPIADSIRAQVLDFESFNQVRLPSGHTRVVINVSRQKVKPKICVTNTSKKSLTYR